MPRNKLNITPPPVDLFLDPVRRDVAPRAGQVGHARMKVKGIDEGKRQAHFLCSTGEVDRYGEIVEPQAYADSIDAFMANPVFPAGHVYIGMSGEPTVIGSWAKVWISQDGLEGIAQFDDEENPLAQRYWNLYRKGHLKAVSVGFIAISWTMRDVMIGEQTKRTRVFDAVELLEISAVAIPAARAALVRAASALDGAVIGDGATTGGDAEKQVETIIERALTKHLNASPGGLLCTLIQDVVEATLHGRDGDYGADDVAFDDDPPVADGVCQADPDINKALASMADAIGA